MIQPDETIVQNFSEALDGLARAIAAINPKQEKHHPPRVPQSANNQQRGEILRDALKALSDVAPEAALDEAEVKEFIEFFSRLYEGECPYRHLYSNVCAVMYEHLNKNPDKLDDGVPYPARNLASNMELIYRSIEDTDRPESVKRSVYKLYDHIELENTRMKYMAQQNKAQIEGVEKLHKEVEDVGSKAGAIREDMENLEGRMDSMQDDLQRNYVTILGIFAAIVIAFATGSAFSSSVIQSMTSVSIYRLAFVMVVLGLFLFDLVMALFFFICRVSKFKEGEHLPALVKWVNGIALAVVVIVFLLRWTHALG